MLILICCTAVAAREGVLTTPDIGQVIVFERYPLDRPDEPRNSEPLDAGREAIGDCALFGYDRAPGVVSERSHGDEMHRTVPGSGLPSAA